MTFHVCVDMDGWVLQRQAESIARHIPGTTFGQSIRLDCDANLYFPYYNLREKGPSLDIALFTHYEQGDDETSERKRKAWHTAVKLADRCVAMSRRALEYLPSGSVVVELEADPQFVAPFVVFGVVGREYQSGRKRNDWAKGLPGQWRYTNGDIPWEQMPEFYAGCDYIVVLSENEGGPMSVKEAIASGKPVLAPDVGWAWDYPVLRYKGADGLRNLVRQLVPHDRTADTARAFCSLVHYMNAEVAA